MPLSGVYQECWYKKMLTNFSKFVTEMHQAWIHRRKTQGLGKHRTEKDMLADKIFYRELVGALSHSLLSDGEVKLKHGRVSIQIRNTTALGVVIASVECHQGLVVSSKVHRTEQDLEFHPLCSTHYSDIGVRYRRQQPNTVVRIHYSVNQSGHHLYIIIFALLFLTTGRTALICGCVSWCGSIHNSIQFNSIKSEQSVPKQLSISN